ncbi:hypothetical protein pb186bvf_005662 [Paramecium bursaria]
MNIRFPLIVMSDNNFQNDLDNLSDNSQKSSRKRVKLNDQSIQSNQQMIEDIKHLASVGSQITAYLEMPTKKVQEYVKKTKQEILIDEVLLDKFLPPNSITPIIFTRKLPTGGQYRVKQNQAPWVTAFENILTCVVQLYYKSDHKISEFMKDKLSDPKKEIKPARPGRKKKQNVDDQTDLLEMPQNGSSYNQLQQDILEILVSPLRNDLPFETWTIKEIAIFECGLCRFGKQYEYISQLHKIQCYFIIFGNLQVTIDYGKLIKHIIIEAILTTMYEIDFFLK